MNNDLIDIKKLKPFTKFIYTIGVLPTSYLMSMTYEEQLIWLCNYIEQTVIPAINNTGEAIEELQTLYVELKEYVDNYFDDLDVQTEINNKLDDMAEHGELEQIIGAYLGTNAIFGINTIADLKANESLIDGSIVKVIGYNAINDGGINTYKVRERALVDVIDDVNIILLDNGLVAELIKKDDFIPLEVENYTKFTGTEGNHATIWYTIISKDYKPQLTIANNQLNTLEHGYENAKNNMSTVTVNAGLFNTETNATRGIIIKDGVTLKGNTDPVDDTEILFMTSDGILHSVDSTTDTAIIEGYNPVWAVNGWYPIIKDGVDLTNDRDPQDFSQRSFIGQDSQGNYIVGVCNGREYYDQGMSLADIIAFCNSVNFTPYFLYNLDGGQSSELDIKGQRVNDLQHYDQDRKVANFITFKSKSASDKSIFETAYTNTKTWLKEESDNNIGINILPMLTPYSNDITIRAGSSAKQYGRFCVINLLLNITANQTTYARLINNMPPAEYSRTVQYFKLMNNSTGTEYVCYVDNSTHQLRLPGSSLLPNGLPSGEYTLNIVYNNASYIWS